MVSGAFDTGGFLVAGLMYRAFGRRALGLDPSVSYSMMALYTSIDLTTYGSCSFDVNDFGRLRPPQLNK